MEIDARPVKALGRHVLIECHECDRAVLNDAARVREILLEGVRRSGATIVTETFHTFSPHGVSGVVVIAESHVTVHTWPEHGYAAVDMFTCGTTVDAEAIRRCIVEGFRTANVIAISLDRGFPASPQQARLALSTPPAAPEISN